MGRPAPLRGDGISHEQADGVGVQSLLHVIWEGTPFPSPNPTLGGEEVDLQAGGIQKLRTQLAHRGAVLQEVMPMAMRNLAIAQQRDRNGS